MLAPSRSIHRVAASRSHAAHRSLLLLALALVVHAPSVSAQAPYSMPWHAIGAVGGPASGGAYALHGVSGVTGGLQAGGAYALYGGFPPPGAGSQVDVERGDPVPRAFRLRVPQPSPFRDRVAIAFELPDDRHVSVLVHAVDGRRVLRLASAHFGAGRHRVIWDGTDDAGRAVHSGMYFVQVIAGNASATQRLVRLQ